MKSFKVVLWNYFYLVLLQFANFIVPLLLVPYLTKVIGIEKYGLIAFAGSFIMYFQIIVDYGFNLSATKKISENRGNIKLLEEVFSSVILIKIIIAIILLFFMAIIVALNIQMKKEWVLYFFTYGIVIGQAIFPLWFFQGVEQMRYITILNVCAKIISFIFILLFVKTESGYILVSLFLSIGYIVSGLAGLLFVQNIYGIKVRYYGINVLIDHLKDGWHVFVSRLFVSLYANSNIFILGLIMGNYHVGLYAMADKVISVFGSFFEPLNQAIYPYMAKKYYEKDKSFYSYAKKILLFIFFINVLFFVLFFFYKNKIVVNLFFENRIALMPVLDVMMFRILSIPYGSYLSNLMIVINEKKKLNKILMVTAIIDLLFVPFSIFYYGLQGLIVTFTIIHYIHVLMLLNAFIYKKNKDQKILVDCKDYGHL